MLEKAGISDARVNQGKPGQPYAWIIMLKVALVGGVDLVRNDGNRQASALAPLVAEDRRRSYYATRSTTTSTTSPQSGCGDPRCRGPDGTKAKTGTAGKARKTP
jgi:hypothetical protein